MRAARNNGVFSDPTFMSASNVRMGFHKTPRVHHVKNPTLSHLKLHASVGNKPRAWSLNGNTFAFRRRVKTILRRAGRLARESAKSRMPRSFCLQ